MNEQLVRYKIITSLAFSSHEKPMAEAMTHIKQVVREEKAWLYINREIYNIDGIKLDAVKNESTIVITNVVMGGR